MSENIFNFSYQPTFLDFCFETGGEETEK